MRAPRNCYDFISVFPPKNETNTKVLFVKTPGRPFWISGHVIGCRHIAICGSPFFYFFPTRIRTLPRLPNHKSDFTITSRFRIGQEVILGNISSVSANRSSEVAICQNEGGFKTTPAAIPKGDFIQYREIQATRLSTVVFYMSFATCKLNHNKISGMGSTNKDVSEAYFHYSLSDF